MADAHTQDQMAQLFGKAKSTIQERVYATIIAVARKIPENVFQEDPKLLMWYNQALTRTGEDT